MTLGENLQDLRKASGLSQEDVAQKLFVSRQSVSKWENDQAEPGVENLKVLAGLYGVTVDALIGNETAGPAPEQPRTEPAEEPDCVLWYKLMALLWTIVVVMENMVLFTMNRLSFSFYWICFLVGLKVRKRAVWVVMTVLAVCDLMLQIGSLHPFGSVLSILRIVVCFAPKTKEYFEEG